MLKRTTEEVAEYFKQQGCELLDEYYGCLEPMDYRCKCGEYGTTTWNNFTKGKRCGHCTKWGHKKKKSLEEVRHIFKERGCEFLDNEYKGINYKYHYRCKCGREAEITFSAFYHQNQTCYYCGLEKHRGPKNHGWVEDRKQLRENQLFRKRCYKALSSSLQKVGAKKVGHTSDMLGYGPKELQEHVKSYPNWDVVKDGDWHLDHIFPIQAFLDYGIKDIKLINCLENLQPLSQQDNNIKKDKYDKKEFEEWLKKKVD